MAPFPPVKRRRITPTESEEEIKATASNQQFYERAAKWNLEQDYEQRPRKNKSKDSGKLPIKTDQGWVAQEKEKAPTEVDADSFLDSGEEAADGKLDVQVQEPKISHRAQVLQAKEDLAKFANLVNEDPEEHLGALKAIAQIATSTNTTIKKLALATQCAVYQDLIPGYRIRPASEEELTAKLSKDVRKLRNYEQALVGGYQLYVRELEQLVKGSEDTVDRSLASVALSCACKLLLAVPHFNFRGELTQMIVSKLSSKKMDDDYEKCLRTVESLFQDDDDGHPSLDAVTLLTKMIKAKNYSVHESVLNTFLHLRLLSEFTFKGSNHSIDKVDVEEEEANTRAKKIKEKRVFLTKRERKMRKERKVVEKEMKEADAEVSHEERDRLQSEMLKLVFAIYFRILKAKITDLMGAVLEGLARYAHLINQDFFGDILEALKELIQSAILINEEDEEGDIEQKEDGSRNPTRESLLCVVTAFALLQGQDVTKSAGILHLDLKFFITHLYRTLYPAALNADIELGPKSFHLPDPLSSNPHASTNKVNAQTTTVLLIRCLSSVLLPVTAVRAVPPMRIAAFTKQLLTASLHLPEKSCLAMLGLLTGTTKTHARKVAALWNTEERRGDGVFDPLRGEVEGSNPFAATVWEGELLRLHFCPKIRNALKGVEKTVLDAQ